MFPFLDLIFRNAWILPIVSLKPSSTNRRKDRLPTLVSWASLVAQTVKDLPAMWETWVQSLGWEDPLEEGMATHSSVFAWRIPWTEEPWGLQSCGHKESDTIERPSTAWHSINRIPLEPGHYADQSKECLYLLISASPGSVHWSGRPPWWREGFPLQYSCLEKSMDGGAWQATARGVTKSLIRLSN